MFRGTAERIIVEDITDIRKHGNTRLSVTADLQQGGIPSKDSKKKLK